MKTDPYGRCIQEVFIAALHDSIDQGLVAIDFGGYLSNYNGSDLPRMRVLFLDENGQVIDSTSHLSTLNNQWTLLRQTVDVPASCRKVHLEMTGTRNAGMDNDSYFDDLFLTLHSAGEECDRYTVGLLSEKIEDQHLSVVPNPVNGFGRIQIPEEGRWVEKMTLINAVGQQHRVKLIVESSRVIFDATSLPFRYVFFHPFGKKWMAWSGSIFG